MRCKARSRAGTAACVVVAALALVGCGSDAAATAPPRSAPPRTVSAQQSQLSTYLARVRSGMRTAGRLERRVLSAVSRYAASPTPAARPATLHVLHSAGTAMGAIAGDLAVTVPPFALVAAHGALASGFRSEAQVIDHLAHSVRTGAHRARPADLAALRELIESRSRWRAAILAYAEQVHLAPPAWLGT